MRSVNKMILYARRVLCLYLTLVLISVECSSIRINYKDVELPKEESNEYHEDSQSLEVENPPAPVPIKIRLNEEVRDNLLLRFYSNDKLQKLIQKTSPSKSRVTRQAPSAPLYPNLTPSPYQSHSVQYYNNSSPNSNSQYGQTNSFNQQWRPNNTQNYPGNPAHPSYNPNTYGPSGFPNPYVQYNNSQFGGKGPHPQNFPSLYPGNYSNQPNLNPYQRPPNYPPNSNNLPVNPNFTPTYNPSQRPPYYQPGNYPVQNTSSRYPNYPHNSPTSPSYNPSQRPAYYQPGNYPAQNTSSQHSSYDYSRNYNASRPFNPSYNPSQRPPYYPQNFSSSHYPNSQNSSSPFFNTTPRSSFGQYPSPSFYSNNQNSSTGPGQFPNMSPNNPFYNPFPNGQNPAGFPSSNFGPSNNNRDRFEDLFKPVIPRTPSRPYDPHKSPSENFANFGYK